jgi:DNA modification methylase
MQNWAHGHTEIEMLPPHAVRPNPRNARTHSKRQIRQLAKNMDAVGFIGAIIIDEQNVIQAGHARYEAAKLRGMRLIPTLRMVGLTETQKRAFALADNKMNEWGGWDRDILAAELGDLTKSLPELNWDLGITGFEPAEIDALFADQDSKPEPEDELPSFEQEVVTQRGDLWILRDHRLLCGDARSRPDLDRLMQSAQAGMMFADPPYNIRVVDVQGRGRIKHQEFAFASGEMSDSEYIAFLMESLGNAARVSVDGAVHYVCHDWRHVREISEAGRKVYGAMLTLCVWAKTNAGQGSFYRSQHELIGVFRVGETRHRNNVELGRHGRNRSNVWSYPGINSFGAGRMEVLAMHPTVKPVALIADAMRDCTTKGDAVLDPFLGSGSTLLAAEKIGRRGYGLEIEPKYVDVAVRRWEAYTKSEAILERDGRTYAEVKAERLQDRHLVERESAAANTAANAGGTAIAVDAMQDGDWVALCGGTGFARNSGEAS